MRYIGMIVDDNAREVGIAWTTGCSSELYDGGTPNVGVFDGYTIFVPGNMPVLDREMKLYAIRHRH
jgi:hypothetical protein